MEIKTEVKMKKKNSFIWINILLFIWMILIIVGALTDHTFSLAMGCFMGASGITGRKLTRFRQFLYVIGTISFITYLVNIIYSIAIKP